MKDIPTSERRAGWETIPLSDAAFVGAGNSAPQKKGLFENGSHPFIRTSDVGQVGFGEIGEARDLLNDIGVKKLRRVSKGAILMPKSGASTFLNHRVETTVDAYISSHLATIEARKNKALPRYLLYFLSTVKAQDLIQDHKYPSLTLGIIGSIPVPLPPLEEQKRIAAVLDQAFAALDRARAHAEANLADAQQLAEIFLDKQVTLFFEKFGSVRLDEIASVKGGKRLPKGEKTSPDRTPFPYISVRDMSEAGTICVDTVQYISEEVQNTIKRYTISSADIYVSIAGTIAKTGTIPEILDGANLTENAAKLVLSEKWDRDFVYWATKSSHFREQAVAQTRTAAQPKLALERLGSITIPNADQEDQIKLRDNMVRFQMEISQIKAAYDIKVADIADLRQSLLQKAFSGQLTA